MVAVADRLKGRSFTRIADWSREELLEVLDLADELKRVQRAGDEHHLLPGRTLGMIFQKPSTRTRVSFEVGIYQLGGTGLYLSVATSNSVAARRPATPPYVLSGYLDAMMMRTFAQSDRRGARRERDDPRGQRADRRAHTRARHSPTR